MFEALEELKLSPSQLFKDYPYLVGDGKGGHYKLAGKLYILRYVVPPSGGNVAGDKIHRYEVTEVC